MRTPLEREYLFWINLIELIQLLIICLLKPRLHMMTEDKQEMRIDDLATLPALPHQTCLITCMLTWTLTCMLICRQHLRLQPPQALASPCASSRPDSRQNPTPTTYTTYDAYEQMFIVAVY